MEPMRSSSTVIAILGHKNSNECTHLFLPLLFSTVASTQTTMRRNISAIFLVLASMSAAHGQGVLDSVQKLFQPAKEFAGISLRSSVKDVKQIGLPCEEGTDVMGGKVLKFISCKDKKYKSEVFGVDFQSREVLFVNERLTVIKVYKSKGWSYETEYNKLKEKLDSVYARTSSPDIDFVRDKKDSEFWNFGNGDILVSASNANCINCGAGIVVITSAGIKALKKEN